MSIAVQHTRPSASLLLRLIGPVVQSNAFSLTLPMNGVCILIGLFYLPHVLQKIVSYQATLGFFTKAQLLPAWFFLDLSILVELTSAICLIFGLFPRWTGLMSAGAMAVATYAIFVANGVGWYWAKGGVEYLVMWGLLSLVVAYDGWKRS